MQSNTDFAFFDFDGTISTGDSFLLFLQIADWKRFCLTCCLRAPQIMLFLAGRYPNQKLKETFLKGLFRGVPMDRFQDLADRFCKEKLPDLIRHEFWEKLQWHREQNHRIVVVTATPRLILAPWCRKHNLEIIGTELATDQDNKLTGELAGLNCMGKEKVRRIRAACPLSAQTTVYAYGDSEADIPMLELAAPENRFFKPFR